MAYETGGATGPLDLLNKIKTFATNNGWEDKSATVNSDRDSGASPDGIARPFGDPPTGSYSTDGARGLWTQGRSLCISKNGLDFMFYTDESDAGLQSDPGPWIGTAYINGEYNPQYDASVPLGSQEQFGNAFFFDNELSPIAWTNKMAGPYQAYHFFEGDQYVHVVVEVTPGSFRHFGVGVLEKAGDYVNGQYAHALRWDFGALYLNNSIDNNHIVPFDSFCNGGEGSTKGTVIRADSDSISPRNILIDDLAVGGGSGWGGFRNPSNSSGDHTVPPLMGMMRMPPSTLTGRAVLLPMLCAAHRPSGNLSMLGSPKDMRWIRMDNFAPNDLFTIGADNWRVFPIIRKNGPAGMENSDNYGIAYRVND